MADVHNIATRSYNMSRIKGTDTGPELIVRKYLHSKGFRYRLHNKKLPGKPDLTLSKYKTVIFINGCFWHGHKECKYFILPKTRTEWWQKKIEGTKSRDRTAKENLEALGWNTIIIWECELKPGQIEKSLMALNKIITNADINIYANQEKR